MRLRLSDERPSALLIEADGGAASADAGAAAAALPLPLSVPLSRCVRLCVGRAEDRRIPWALPSLLEALQLPPPPPPPAGAAHLCLTVLISGHSGGGAAEVGAAEVGAAEPAAEGSVEQPMALHLVAASRAQLEDWSAHPPAWVWRRARSRIARRARVCVRLCSVRVCLRVCVCACARVRVFALRLCSVRVCACLLGACAPAIVCACCTPAS